MEGQCTRGCSCSPRASGRGELPRALGKSGYTPLFRHLSPGRPWGRQMKQKQALTPPQDAVISATLTPFLPAAQLCPDTLRGSSQRSTGTGTLGAPFGRCHRLPRPPSPGCRSSPTQLGSTRSGTSLPPRSGRLRGDLPAHRPQHPNPLPLLLLSGLTRGAAGARTGAVTQGAHPFSHRPSRPAALDARLPHPQHPVGGASGAPRPGTKSTSSPARLRHRSARLELVGGAPARCPPVWGPRTRSSARWGAEGGPAEVGLAEGGNGGDAITKLVRSGRAHSSPPPPPPD